MQQTSLQYLKGIGPPLAALLAKVGLHTVADVLANYPRRYEDRRALPPIASLQPGQKVTVRGTLSEIRAITRGRGRVIVKATITDPTGAIQLLWFNQPWIKTKLAAMKGEVLAYGLVKPSGFHLEMHSPEMEEIRDEDRVEDFARIVPVYSLTEGVHQWMIRRAVGAALRDYLPRMADPLPTWMREEFDLPDLATALRNIHQPENEAACEAARRRLVFDEFLALQVVLQLRRRNIGAEVGIAFPISQLPGLEHWTEDIFKYAEKSTSSSIWDDVRRILPFELTAAQAKAIREIWSDMQRPAPMNRLLHGDVGSGKTAVAACAMLAAVRCGYQAALMAPTEILAEQHHANLENLFAPLGIDVTLLVGKQPAAEKRKARAAAAGGGSGVFVGTHALIQEGVQFRRLGLVVIDEQHRFGVMQRLALRGKGLGNPDVLVMTATPIPRTLTMLLYGDLDVSVLDMMPPGRKPIKTHWRKPHERSKVYEGVAKLLQQGRQAYFVCPMISESDKMQTQAAMDLHYRLSHDEFKGFRVGLLHGQMKAREKEAVMEQFRRHELDILVSTVVIEVGVDVPNATVMVIEDANRFGLSQLHQLRGRVGRGPLQSYCVLIADATSDEARERMEILQATTDGFRIAEKDLELRGPGDLVGTRQSGALQYKLADVLKDERTLEQARQAAIMLLERDPDLHHPAHRDIRRLLAQERTEESLVAAS